jgi:hypothetical protein
VWRRTEGHLSQHDEAQEQLRCRLRSAILVADNKEEMNSVLLFIVSASIGEFFDKRGTGQSAEALL